MRALALAALCGLTFTISTAAEAQSRRLVLNVKPRSWLDAGPVVPVGAMTSYVYDHIGMNDARRFGARGSDPGMLSNLARPGTGFTFETPIIPGF